MERRQESFFNESWDLLYQAWQGRQEGAREAIEELNAVTLEEVHYHWPPMMLAIEYNLPRVMHFYLQKAFTPAERAVFISGARWADHTLLHYACRQRHEQMVLLWLSYGADPQAQDAQGFTALHYAAYHSYFDVIQFYRDHGHHLDGQASNRTTALIIAALLKKDDVMLALLDAGANILLADHDGRRFLDILIASHHNAMIKAIPEDRNEDIVAYASTGLDPLAYACSLKQSDIALELMHRGADLFRNAPSTPRVLESGRLFSALEYVFYNNLVDVLRAAVAKNSPCPLDDAARSAYFKYVLRTRRAALAHAWSAYMTKEAFEQPQTFASSDASLVEHSQHHYPQWHLFQLASLGAYTLLEAYEACGAALDKIDAFGRCAYDYALLSGHLPTVQFFIARGIHTIAPDHTSARLLEQMSYEHGDSEDLKKLFDIYLTQGHITPDFFSSLHILYRVKQTDVVHDLFAKGYDPNLRSTREDVDACLALEDVEDISPLIDEEDRTEEACEAKVGASLLSTILCSDDSAYLGCYVGHASMNSTHIALEHLLMYPGIELSNLDKHGNNLFHYLFLSYDASRETMKISQEDGLYLDISFMRVIEKCFSLHYPSLATPEKIKELLNEKNALGDTPLEHAFHRVSRENAYDLAITCLSFGADPSLKQGDGLSFRQKHLTEGDMAVALHCYQTMLEKYDGCFDADYQELAKTLCSLPSAKQLQFLYHIRDAQVIRILRSYGWQRIKDTSHDFHIFDVRVMYSDDVLFAHDHKVLSLPDLVKTALLCYTPPVLEAFFQREAFFAHYPIVARRTLLHDAVIAVYSAYKLDRPSKRAQEHIVEKILLIYDEKHQYFETVKSSFCALLENIKKVILTRAILLREEAHEESGAVEKTVLDAFIEAEEAFKLQLIDLESSLQSPLFLSSLQKVQRHFLNFLGLLKESLERDEGDGYQHVAALLEKNISKIRAYNALAYCLNAFDDYGNSALHYSFGCAVPFIIAMVKRGANPFLFMQRTDLTSGELYGFREKQWISIPEVIADSYAVFSLAQTQGKRRSLFSYALDKGDSHLAFAILLSSDVVEHSLPVLAQIPTTMQVHLLGKARKKQHQDALKRHGLDRICDDEGKTIADIDVLGYDLIYTLRDKGVICLDTLLEMSLRYGGELFIKAWLYAEGDKGSRGLFEADAQGQTAFHKATDPRSFAYLTDLVLTQRFAASDEEMLPFDKGLERLIFLLKQQDSSGRTALDIYKKDHVLTYSEAFSFIEQADICYEAEAASSSCAASAKPSRHEESAAPIAMLSFADNRKKKEPLAKDRAASPEAKRTKRL